MPRVAPYTRGMVIVPVLIASGAVATDQGNGTRLVRLTVSDLARPKENSVEDDRGAVLGDQPACPSAREIDSRTRPKRAR